MKKTPLSGLSKIRARSRSAVDSWHNGADIEICFYARSLRKAARTLIETLELDRDARTDWDAFPVILLYRQAIEIHLKSLVGEGSNFLVSPTDHITLYKTHSLRWLAQIVCRIVRAVKWESEFTCEGVSSLAGFTALVNELEALDPVSCAVHSSGRAPFGSVPQQLQRVTVVQFARRLDALLVLVNETADALAATWDLRQDEAAGVELDDADDFGPTIQ